MHKQSEPKSYLTTDNPQNSCEQVTTQNMMVLWWFCICKILLHAFWYMLVWPLSKMHNQWLLYSTRWHCRRSEKLPLWLSLAISKIFITTVSSACLQNNQFVFAVNHWELKSQFLFSILEPYVISYMQSLVPLYTKGIAISILLGKLVNFVSIPPCVSPTISAHRLPWQHVSQQLCKLCKSEGSEIVS